jgi:hypothetical protein
MEEAVDIANDGTVRNCVFNDVVIPSGDPIDPCGDTPDNCGDNADICGDKPDICGDKPDICGDKPDICRDSGPPSLESRASWFPSYSNEDPFSDEPFDPAPSFLSAFG